MVAPTTLPPATPAPRTRALVTGQWSLPWAALSRGVRPISEATTTTVSSSSFAADSALHEGGEALEQRLVLGALGVVAGVVSQSPLSSWTGGRGRG